jgi:integrase
MNATLGEIHALTWSDIDFTNGNIAIRDPKNSKNRFAHMTADVSTMLQNRYTQQARNTTRSAALTLEGSLG